MVETRDETTGLFNSPQPPPKSETPTQGSASSRDSQNDQTKDSTKVDTKSDQNTPNKSEVLTESEMAAKDANPHDVSDCLTGATPERLLEVGMDPAVEAVLRKDRRMVSGDEDGTLPSAVVPEAEYDLHEKLEWVDRDVQALREIVEAEPRLKSRLDRPFLLSFLRARKFDYDKAMVMVRGYYRARQENAEMYVDLAPSALDHVWDLHMQTVLPTPDKLGRTVLIFRTGAWLPEVCTLDDVFRSQVIMLEHIVRVPITQLRGITAVVDCAGLSMTHAYYLTPTHIRRMISVIQEVFPLRFKALHFVHEPSIFDWVFSLVKPFLSDTIKGRLHFHGEDLQSLHQHIPAEELPEELGGTQGPMDNSEFVQNLKLHEEYFKEHFTYGFEAPEEAPRQGTMMEAVTDMGSLIGSYYRRMCID
ncbi:alpha-tocopherol transfer protein-like isoform X2 [Palaemon carinicauda]